MERLLRTVDTLIRLPNSQTVGIAHGSPFAVSQKGDVIALPYQKQKKYRIRIMNRAVSLGTADVHAIALINSANGKLFVS